MEMPGQFSVKINNASEPLAAAIRFSTLRIVSHLFIGASLVSAAVLAPAIGAFLDPTTTLEVDNDRRPQCAYSGPSDAIRPVDR